MAVHRAFFIAQYENRQVLFPHSNPLLDRIPHAVAQQPSEAELFFCS